MIGKTMRPRSKSPPQTPAERQAKCRAIKRGERQTFPTIAVHRPPGIPPTLPMLAKPPTAQLPAPTTVTLPALPAPPASPATPVTPMWKTVSAAPLAVPGAGRTGDASRLSLPPAVAARLQSLLDRHHAGKTPLTPAERAEAQGLLDMAEFFVVQRLRQRLAA